MIKVKVKRTLHSSKHSHSTPPITSPPHLAGPDEAEVLACLKVEEGGFGAGAIGRVKPEYKNHISWSLTSSQWSFEILSGEHTPLAESSLNTFIVKLIVTINQSAETDYPCILMDIISRSPLDDYRDFQAECQRVSLGCWSFHCRCHCHCWSCHTWHCCQATPPS